MVEQKIHSESFKRQVAKVYLTGTQSSRRVAEDFNISCTSVLSWASRYKDEFSCEAAVVQEITTFGAVTNTSHPIKKEKLTEDQILKRIAELEQKLEHETMHRRVLDTMIDVAERNLNLSIRKKAGVKQSK